MAEIVGSAVASEAVSRISSFVSGDKISHESVEDKAERLEMAVLKIQSIVAVTEDRHISHLPLLHWKAKLKRVAKEGDEILHVHKKRTLESNGVSNSATGNSISQYLIQAAKRVIPFRHKEDGLGDSTLRRFERLADGAESFFRLVESGGRPKGSIFLPSLTRSLLAGDSMKFSLRRENGNDLVVLWPWLDRDVENGLEAFLVVSHEDELMWQKNFMIVILFRLSESANLLEIGMSCLELLPPQFDAACVATRRLLTETIAQSNDHSNLSETMIWCCRQMQSYHRSDCESSTVGRHFDTRMLLPQPILRLTTVCYASPPIARSSSPMKDRFPLQLECHMSPYLLPENHSNQFEQVEQGVIRELLPRIIDGCYDAERQASNCRKQIWCPQSSIYCSVTPAISQPLTMSQAYQMRSVSAPSRRRTAGTKSNTTLKSRKITRT